MRNIEKDEIEMAARRETMLNEGFRLFSEGGIASVSMQEVANACKLGIATLYRYYNTKLALVLDIGTRRWEEYGSYVVERRREMDADSMTAAEELSFYLGFYVELYKDHKALLCFNQDFNNYVQHEGANMEQLKPYTKAISNLGTLFHPIYEKGQRDGTIRTDMPEGKMFSFTAHIMLAAAVRYAQGLLYEAGDEADRTGDLEFLKRMILKEFVAA